MNGSFSALLYFSLHLDLSCGQIQEGFRQLQVLRIGYRAVDHHHAVIGHRLLEDGNPGLVLSLLRYGWNGVRPEAATCPKAGM